ncbi:MAG: DMT family transporter [Pseudomonadales bacterium]|nr:DMT family transporter [Pseudomonadales bacterium]
MAYTLFAAFFQNLRSALQKNLSNDFGATASAYTRFLYALPFAIIYTLTLFTLDATQTPALSIQFTSYILIGGTAQILGTTFLIKSFENKQFAQGTAFSKTEVLQTALIGLVLLGESITLILITGILISLAGVFGLIGYKNIFAAFKFKADSAHPRRTALYGIVSGTGFALSAVAYRAASLGLEGELSSIKRAAITLICVLGFQTISMGLYLVWKEPGKLLAVLKEWRAGMWVGLAGMLGSTGWFIALAMQQAAHVRALGQLELVFAMLTSVLVFKEQLKPSEYTSIFVLIMGILMIVLGG